MKSKYIIPLIALLLTVSCKRTELLAGGCEYILVSDELSLNGLVFDSQAQTKTVDAGGVGILIIDDAAGKMVRSPFPEPGEVTGRYVLECDWISLDTFGEGMKIMVKENTTGKDREVGIHLSSGNCGGSFLVTQKAATE